MIDTAVPTAFSGLMVGGLTAFVLPDRAAAEEAIGPGKTDEGATAGLSIFLAESCRRVLTTRLLACCSWNSNKTYPILDSFPSRS
jgi:hypothetical protein